jgi:hypothetical protein
MQILAPIRQGDSHIRMEDVGHVRIIAVIELLVLKILWLVQKNLNISRFGFESHDRVSISRFGFESHGRVSL